MRRIVLRAALCLLCACSLEIAGPSHSYFGTWHLRSINGQPLPYEDGSGLVVVSQQITIKRDHTFSGNDNQTSAGQQVGRSYSGTCSLKSASQLVCRLTDGSEFGFIWEGDSLYTALPSGFSFVLRR
jgi:hypothetical protein